MQDTLAPLTVLADRGDAAAWQEAAELIRRTGGYRWAGLYEVTATPRRPRRHRHAGDAV